MALCRVAVSVGDDLDALSLKSRHQLFVVQGVLAAHDVMQGCCEPLKRPHRKLPLAVTGLHGNHMGLGPHLEKFIQIGRHDAQVTQTLQQGHIAAHGPIQHTFVEGQDAVVAVQ